MRTILFILGLVLIGAIGVVFYLKDGGELPQLDDVTELLPGESSDSPTQVYRWRNPDGTWQYGDKPPATVNAEPVEIRPNIKPIDAD